VSFTLVCDSRLNRSDARLWDVVVHRTMFYKIKEEMHANGGNVERDSLLHTEVETEQ
jgi:hypothetical protein